MTQYLLDTNVISELLKKEPNQKVQAWIRSLAHFYVCSITLEELVYGLRKKSMPQREGWLRRFLDDKASIVAVDFAAAYWAGEKRAELTLRGITVTQADACIAGATWQQACVLATKNTPDFVHFGIPLLNPF